MPASWARDLVLATHTIDAMQKDRFIQAGLKQEVEIKFEDRRSFRCEIALGQDIHTISLSSSHYKAVRLLAVLFLRSEFFTAFLGSALPRHDSWCPAQLRHLNEKEVWSQFIENINSGNRDAELQLYHSVGDFEPPMQSMIGFSPESFSYWLSAYSLMFIFFHEEAHLWSGHIELKSDYFGFDSLRDGLKRYFRDEKLGEVSDQEIDDILEIRANLAASASLAEMSIRQRRQFSKLHPNVGKEVQRANFILGDVLIAFATIANLVIARTQNTGPTGTGERLLNICNLFALTQTVDQLSKENLLIETDTFFGRWNGLGRFLVELAGIEFTPPQDSLEKHPEFQRIITAHLLLHRLIDRLYPERGFGKLNPSLSRHFDFAAGRDSS